MTGNTVLLGINIFGRQADRAIYYLCIIATFLAAIILARVALVSRLPIAVPLVASAVLLGATELIAGEWSATLAAAALGLQVAAVRKIGGVWINTAFTTGDLLRLGTAVPRADEPEERNEILVLTVAWIAYAAGAVLGALALRAILYPMIVPALLALGAAMVETSVAHRNAMRGAR